MTLRNGSAAEIRSGATPVFPVRLAFFSGMEYIKR